MWQCTQDVPAPTSPSTASDVLPQPAQKTNSAQRGASQEDILQKAWTYAIDAGLDAELIRILDIDSTKSDEGQRQTTVCHNYYMVYYTNGVETGRDFLFRDCFTVGDDNGSSGGGDSGGGTSGGSGGTGTGCRGCGGNTGPNVINSIKNAPNLTPGPKPLSIYFDRCSGAAGLWSMGTSNNFVEAYGYLTPTGEFIATAVVGATGGNVGQGLYTFNNGVSTSYYYYYPVSPGSTPPAIAGTLTVRGNYYIPVTASVHTHTPCLFDGTDGISNMILSAGDSALAASHPGLNNYI